MGRLTVASTTSLDVRGGDGQAGAAGGIGHAGNAPKAATNSTGGGGNGGLGATGGASGKGAAGGGGGGGAGGTILLSASVLDAATAVVHTEGAAGGYSPATGTSAPKGADGRLVFASNSEGGMPTQRFGDQVPEVITAQRMSNPFNNAVATAPIAALSAGARPYGLLGPSVTPASLGIAAVGAEDLFAVLRLNANDPLVPSSIRSNYTGFDFVFVVNLTDVPLVSPKIGLNGTAAQPLMWANFAGPKTINALAAHQVWVTLVPDTAAVTVSADAFGGGAAVTALLNQPLDIGLANRRVVKVAVPAFLAAAVVGGLQDLAVANLPIRDLQTTQSVLRVADNLSVTDVNVGLDITHSVDSNLSVVLVSPAGTQVNLFAGVGGTGKNFSGTVLDDEAAAPIGAQSAPFTGVFKPQGALQAFDGQSAAGNWTLRITDGAGAGVGTLDSWSLTLTGADNVAHTYRQSGAQVYAVNPAEDTLVVVDAGSLGLRQQLSDGFDGITTLDVASGVAIAPDGNQVYVVSTGDNGVSVFARDVNGDLTFQQSINVLGATKAYEHVAVRPVSGDRVAMAGQEAIVQYLRDRAGALSWSGGYQYNNTVDLSYSVDGSLLYAVRNDELRILDGSDLSDRGALQGIAGASAVAVAASANGQQEHVYLTTSTGELRVFMRNIGSATLTVVQTLQDNVGGIRGLLGARDVMTSADGSFVYVVTDGQAGNTLTAFARNRVSGALEFAQVLRGGAGLVAPSTLGRSSDGQVYLSSTAGFGSTAGGLATFAQVVGASQVPRSFTVRQDGIERLSLETGAYDDVVRQVNAAPVKQLTIITGAGADTVDLLTVGVATVVQSGGGGDRITVRSDTVGVATLTVDAGAEDDTVIVRELSSDDAVTLLLGAGNDAVQIAGEKLPAASITLNGGPGGSQDFDTLRFSTGGAAINPSAPTLPNGTIKVANAALGTVTYTSIEAIPGFIPSVAQAGGPYNLIEGGSLALAGSATAAPSTTLVSTRWDLNGDGVFGDALGLTPVLSWQQLGALGINDDGSYKITLEVADSAGNVVSDTRLLTITNKAPILAVSGDTAALVGQPVRLNLSKTDPGNDTLTQWAIDWGDRAPGVGPEILASDASTASHVYLQTGVYRPVLVATDEDGTGSFTGNPATTPYTTQAAALTVAPPVPTITTVGTATALQILEGQAVRLHVAAAGAPTAFTWDLDGNGSFGDEAGVGSVSGSDITLSAANLATLGIDNGTATYPIRARVVYGSGAAVLGVNAAIGVASLQVLNAQPTAQLTNATLSPGRPTNEGAATAVSVTAVSDPSAADRNPANGGFRYSYDFDNNGVFEPGFVGIADAQAVVPGAFLKDAGVHTVRVVVTDRDGGALELFTGVRVAEVLPTLNLVGGTSSTEGLSYSLNLSATDPGNDTVNRWTIDWGDGSSQVVNAATAALNHVFADNGALTIAVTARDGDGLYFAIQSVAVANVAPTLSLTGAASIDEGNGYLLTFGATDPGADTLLRWDISWGDGSSESLAGSATTASHRYADDSGSGVYSILVSATDEDGSSTAGRTVKVLNVAPTVVFSGIGTAAQALAGGPVAAGRVAIYEGSNFTLQIAPPTDRGTDSATGYSINWGDGSSLQAVAAARPLADGLVPTLSVLHVYADGDALRTIAVTLTDEDGSYPVAAALLVEVRNVAPLAQLTNSTLGAGRPVSKGGSATVSFIDASDPSPVDRAAGYTYSFDFGDDGSVEVVNSLSASVAVPTALLSTAGVVTVRGVITDKNGGAYSTVTGVRVVASTALLVNAFTLTPSGLHIGFNRNIDPARLNLYATQTGGQGAADVVLVGATTGAVTGSLVLDDDRTGFTFVKTGSALATDVYTLTLRSAADGFVDTAGRWLDGNNDGLDGGNFTSKYSVNASGALLSIIDIARGPGQAVNQPATGSGLPVTLSNAIGASRVEFTLAYDAALLTVTGASLAAGLPAGSTIGTDLSRAGRAVVTVTLGAALTSASARELVRLQAVVPLSAAALYTQKQVLDLSNVSINGGAIPVRDDDGVHVNAYVGDATGNRGYSTLDVQRLQRVVVRFDSGFAAYPLLDPAILGDTTGNGSFNSLDVQRLQQRVVGLPQTSIPALPTPGLPLLTFSGADPFLRLGSAVADAGAVVVIPVEVDDVAGIESVQFTLGYSASLLTLVAVRQAGVAVGFQYRVDQSGPGAFTIDVSRLEPVAASGPSRLFELEFLVAKDAPAGSIPIDLQWAALNETALTLNPQPQPGWDATDGQIVVRQGRLARPVLAAPRGDVDPATPNSFQLSVAGGLMQIENVSALPPAALPKGAARPVVEQRPWVAAFVGNLGQAPLGNPNDAWRVTLPLAPQATRGLNLLRSN